MGKNKKTQKPTALNRIIPARSVVSAAKEPIIDPVLEYLQRDRSIKPWAQSEKPAGSRDASGRNPFLDPPKTPKWETFANQSSENRRITQNSDPMTARCTKIKKEKQKGSKANPFRVPSNVPSKQFSVENMTETDKCNVRKAVVAAARNYYGTVPAQNLETAVQMLAKRAKR